MLFNNSFRTTFLLAGFLALSGAAICAAGQSRPSRVPYASIGGAKYAGPNRESAYDLKGPTIRIGLMAPLHGPEKSAGQAIVAAAKLGLQNAMRVPLPDGRRISLTIVDTSVPPWGALGDEIIRMVIQKKVVAIVTSASAVTAHLSEQIGTKIGVPVLTLSSDPTTTEIHLPWIFRMGPSDKQQARIIAHQLYQQDGFHRVVLVSELNPGGRAGATAFTKAMRRLGASPPVSFVINPSKADLDRLAKVIKVDSPQAVVLWTPPCETSLVIALVRRAAHGAVIYLCQASAQAGSGITFPLSDATLQPSPPRGRVFVVVSRQWGNQIGQQFARRYDAETGNNPTPVAAEAYDAVTLIVRALRKSGPNRARLRDQLAAGQGFYGVSGLISFDNQGNNRAVAQLIGLRLLKPQAKKVDPRQVSGFNVVSIKKGMVLKGR
jgi:branched-chain amino acid transport system substrate-binding protein